MRSFDCVICGFAEIQLIFDSSKEVGLRGISRGEFWMCANCGPGFCPKDNESEMILPSSEVVSDPESGINPLWIREEIPHHKIWNRWLDLIKKLANKPGNLLDIGCYNGYFMDEAQKIGWKFCIMMISISSQYHLVTEFLGENNF